MKYIFILAGRGYALEKALIKEKSCNLIKPKENLNILIRILIRLYLKSFLRKKEIIFKKIFEKELSKIQIEKEDKIIVLDSEINIYGLKYLRKRFSENKIIFWFFNTNDYGINMELIKKYTDKVCSFDKNDCEKYKMEYFYKFFPYNKIEAVEEFKYKFNAVFIGLNKNRIRILKTIEEELLKLGQSTFFHILNEKKFTKIKGTTKKRINYSETEKYIYNSDIIVEILKENQDGITIRTLEAFYNEKKLITNNKNIKKYDFYSPKNIFIIEDLKNIKIDKDFILNKNFYQNYNIVENYSFKNWIEELIRVEGEKLK